MSPTKKAYLIVTPILSVLTIILLSFWYNVFHNIYENRAIVSNMQIVSEWKVKTGSVEARVFGTKNRAECQLLHNKTVGYAFNKNTGVYDLVPFQFVRGKDLPPHSKPAGTFNFGIWRWYGIKPHHIRVTTVTSHLCNYKLKTTVIGPFNLPKF